MCHCYLPWRGSWHLRQVTKAQYHSVGIALSNGVGQAIWVAAYAEMAVSQAPYTAWLAQLARLRRVPTCRPVMKGLLCPRRIRKYLLIRYRNHANPPHFPRWRPAIAKSPHCTRVGIVCWEGGLARIQW